MNKIPYYDLHNLVRSITNIKNRNAIIDSYIDHVDKIIIAKGSKAKHQAWEGGYLDHVVYSTNYAIQLYKLNNDLGIFPIYQIGDVITVMLLHDIGKIVKYDNALDADRNLIEKKFQQAILNDYDWDLSDDQLNALKYIHGEGDDYCGDRVMSKLATICHQADIWNARYSYNYPKVNDIWANNRHNQMTDLKEYVIKLGELKEKDE